VVFVFGLLNSKLYLDGIGLILLCNIIFHAKDIIKKTMALNIFQRCCRSSMNNLTKDSEDPKDPKDTKDPEDEVPNDSKSPPPFDIDSFLKMFDNDKNFVSELIDLFLESLPNYVAELETCDNLSIVKNTAHAIKGSAANMECSDLKKLAARLETYAASGVCEPVEMHEKIQPLVLELNKVMKFMKSSEVRQILFGKDSSCTSLGVVKI
jgi:HPt (histidine-containing phosphotransfer) domain-containing protein